MAFRTAGVQESSRRVRDGLREVVDAASDHGQCAWIGGSNYRTTTQFGRDGARGQLVRIRVEQ